MFHANSREACASSAVLFINISGKGRRLFNKNLPAKFPAVWENFAADRINVSGTSFLNFKNSPAKTSARMGLLYAACINFSGSGLFLRNKFRASSIDVASLVNILSNKRSSRSLFSKIKCLNFFIIICKIVR